ncbi:unnamed protein product [Calicophoron daubneyi]
MCSMSSDEFLTYWRSFHDGTDNRLLYLKDWHYFKTAKNKEYYRLPELFSSDWLNEFWSLRKDVDDDYRFVYLGPKGTWTPLHADVYHSYSWSANIVGIKRWWFFPPGEEKKLCDKNGHVPIEVRGLPLDKMDVRHFVIEQHPGQIVFVPSGWYHEVLNLTDCVSINHNWFNATNVDWIWEHLQDQLRLVQESTSDVRNTPGWHEQCQICLRALAGLNFPEFLTILKYIILTRWPNKNTTSSARKAIESMLKNSDNSFAALDEALDAKLSGAIDKDPLALRSAGEHQDQWKEVMRAQPTVTSESSKTPEWIRSHDFSSAVRVARQVLKHPDTELLQLAKRPLKDYFTEI